MIGVKSLGLVFFLGCFLTGYGQHDKVTIRVVDGLSEQPLSDVRALNQTDSSQAVTNSRGFLELPATVGDSLVLTADGYEAGMIVVPESSPL